MREIRTSGSTRGAHYTPLLYPSCELITTAIAKIEVFFGSHTKARSHEGVLYEKGVQDDGRNLIAKIRLVFWLGSFSCH